jgi:hypothetical protein
MLGRNEEAAVLAMQISGIIGDAHPEDAARCYSTLAEVYEELVTATALSSSPS